MPISAHFAGVLAMMGCVGCAPISASRTYSGTYLYGFEQSYLIPETHKGEHWCITQDMSEAKLSWVGVSGGGAHVIVRGRVTRGTAPCDQMLKVEKIIEVSDKEQTIE
ncbi:MAG: hypothetical protein OJF55_001133 [Rhodanobacteraceae bacterium]|nr:MAG: hypothetical protein OJF55_001133 [Rhodanobacteraceae bacterium]